jgi:hypothetical protein
MAPIFPRNHRLCTKVPIQVHMRNSDACAPVTLEVWNTRTQSLEEEAHVIPEEFAFMHIREKIQDIIKRECGEACRAVSMEHVIIVTIKSPYVPSVDLVDLPGIVGAPEDLKHRTSELVESQIAMHGQSSLFLATLRATLAPNSSVAMDIVQTKKLQDRTVGVFTMCDHAMALPDCKEAFLERLMPNPPPDSGLVNLDSYGWVCVMNANPECQNDVQHKESEGSACIHSMRLRQQAHAEDTFLKEKMADIYSAGVPPEFDSDSCNIN